MPMEVFEFPDTLTDAGTGTDEFTKLNPVIAEERICSRHNNLYQTLTIPLTGGTLLFCEDCNSELVLAEDEATLQRVARQKQLSLNTALDRAMLAPRFKQKTLENYIAKTLHQQAAVGAAKWFLEQVRTSHAAGLILLGTTGTGKGHLAAGIINAFVQHSGGTALFTEAAKFVRAIKESWRKGKEGLAESEILSLYTEPDLLIIDEVGVQFGSETEKMYLTELINDRYAWLKSTVLIGNLTILELTTLIGQRAMDRLRENGKVVICDWESFRNTAMRGPDAENQALKQQ